MTEYEQYESLAINVEDQIATMEILQPTPEEAWRTHLADITGAIRAMRTDERLRVIVITGPESVDPFYVSPPADAYDEDERRERILSDKAHVPPDFATVLAIEMLETEKILVSKVNGDSFGGGTSLIFGSDFVVAEADARIAEGHMDMRENDPDRGYMPEWEWSPVDWPGRSSRCSSRGRHEGDADARGAVDGGGTCRVGRRKPGSSRR